MMNKEINNDNSAQSKPMIFLKASVIGMGIVFMVLVMAFILIKQKKSVQKVDNCQSFLETGIAFEVDKIELQGSNIIILTKLNPKTKKQEIIKIDSNCSKIINRITLNVI